MVAPGLRLIALRRTSVDVTSVVAVLLTVLVVCALVSGVAATLPSLQQQALRSAMQELPPDETVVEAVASYDAEAAARHDEAVRAALQPVVAVTGGVVARQTETVRHETADGWSGSFVALTGDRQLTTAVAGRLPGPSSRPRVEVAVPAGDPAAPGVGSRLVLTSPLDGSRIPVLVVGSWKPVPEARRALAAVGPASLLVHEQSFEGLAPRAASVRWRAAPAVERLHPDDLGRLRTAVLGTDHAVVAAGESVGTSIRVENPLPDVVDARSRELLAQRMLLLVPALLLLLLGAAAAVLVATALSETRRRDEMLLRSRGADRRQLVGPSALEATVLCLVGALGGPVIANAVIRIGDVRPVLGITAWTAGAAAAAICWAALVVPVTARAFSGDRGEQLSVERRRRRVLTSLIALTLLMVALGIVAVVRLEDFASTVAGAGRWSGEVDPLLVAAPSLLLLSLVTVLALALLPLLFRLTEWVARSSGVALAVGTRSVSRAPGKSVPLALAVALVAGGVAFATVERASQQQAREVRASYDVGADVRATAPPRSSRTGVAEERAVLTGLAGVEAVSGVQRELDFVDDVGAEVLVAELGGKAADELLAAAPDPEEAVTRLLQSADQDAVPVAVTEDLAASAALERGSVFELVVADARTRLVVVETLAFLPTVREGRAGVLIDSGSLRRQVPAAGGGAPDEWWLAVTAEEVESVAAELRARPELAADVLTRDQALRRLAADPGTGGAALADVMTVTAVGSLLIGGVLLGSVVVLRRRERDLQASFLRALGASERDVTMTLATEYTVATGGGIVAGALAGVVTAAIALRATALGAGGRPLVPAPDLAVPWAWTLLLLAPLLVVPMAALLALTRSGRGGDVSLADGRVRA